ncbi:MAG: metallophosphoesterase [Humidesulfovibrio sp.]|nr:metallophosphoesterase [Humidesulfovibrio sp.]
MRFYLVFTLVFMFMLAVSLAQARRQIGLADHASWGLLAVGLVISALLASTRLMPESWTMDLARPLWWLGYGIFAVVAYFFLFQVILFTAEMFARLALPRFAPALCSPRALVAVLALTGLVVGYGTRELDNVRVLKRTIVSPKLSQPLRLVAVSDLHMGAMTLASRVDALVALLKAQNPDVLLIVGDLVNDHPEALKPLASKFLAARPRLGTFGVFGNHERYEGDEKSAAVFRWAGAKLLRNRVAPLPGTEVQILGVDDPGRAGNVTAMLDREIRDLAPYLDPARVSVLLNHRPQAWREAAQPLGIELMLSGHTHRGQLYPFYLVVSLSYEFMGGFYEEGGKVLGVSGGAGFWGPPLRVLAPPDILVVDLLPQAAPTAQ